MPPDRAAVWKAANGQMYAALCHAVRDVAGDEVAPDELFRDEPVWPGASSTLSQPLPAVAVSVAVMLRSSAEAMVDRHVKRARGDGIGWQDLAILMFITADTAREAALAAFEQVAGDDGEFTWTCGTCHELITDYGPAEHAADAETGHASNCGRNTADHVDNQIP